MLHLSESLLSLLSEDQDVRENLTFHFSVVGASAVAALSLETLKVPAACKKERSIAGEGYQFANCFMRNSVLAREGDNKRKKIAVE